MTEAQTGSQVGTERPTPEIQRFLDDLNRIGNPLDTMTAANVAGLRAQREAMAPALTEVEAVERVRDVLIPAPFRVIPARVYTPADRRLAREGKLPVVVFFHGGGWTLGGIASYDAIARGLANRIPAIAVSVAYRLAPEFPFPAGLDDARVAVRWVADNAAAFGGDGKRLAVAGDSAGGNLATVAALDARRAGLAVLFQALFYASTDIANTDYPSYRQWGDGYLLTRRAVETFRSFYLPNREDWGRPEASPFRMNEADLRLMPGALVVTCGCDPLRDEGEAYARRLRTCGVRADYRMKGGMIHACLNLFGSRLYPQASRQAEGILEEAGGFIRAAFMAEDSRANASSGEPPP
ncbi:MAG TPA: alpha/beta hydrolase [Tepidisphaeraceae bacterium]|jgi:acetyl esterase|nr:alpha/beta hydrolase [Tepidisphaeraceae bacterium]